MARQYVIPPAFTLPAKQPTRNINLHQFERATYIVLTACATGTIGYLIYRFLAPWPIYRLVGFAVLLILASNIMSGMVRMRKQVPAKMVPMKGLIEDTTGYLVAIRVSFERKAP